MTKKREKLVVRKYSIEEEQQKKDDEFRQRDPAERLRINEMLGKRIWGDRYNALSVKGLVVISGNEKANELT